MSYRMKIGAEIKKIRVALRHTQYTFAGFFNSTKPSGLREVTQKDISRYELGQVAIPAEILEHIRTFKR